MICLLGGTFDPVHVGHVHAARQVCDALGVAEIRLLLAARPGHRGATGASAPERWDMLVLACREEPRLSPDATELRRAELAGRPSYTVETLEALRQAHPQTPLVWVVGSDAYLLLATWHRWREVFELANLVVLGRPGAGFDLRGELAALTRERQVSTDFPDNAGGVRLLEAPMLDVSATAIRDAIAHGSRRTADGRAVADLLPPAVYTYIKQYHLYGVVSDP